MPGQLTNLRYDKNVPSWWMQDNLVTKKIANRLSDFIIQTLGLGASPPEYNPAKHGPYDPRVKYTSTVPEPRFSELKLGQLPEWALTREIRPLTAFRAAMRVKNRIMLYYKDTRHPVPGLMIVFLAYGIIMPAYAVQHWRHVKHNTKFKHH